MSMDNEDWDNMIEMQDKILERLDRLVELGEAQAADREKTNEKISFLLEMLEKAFPIFKANESYEHARCVCSSPKQAGVSSVWGHICECGGQIISSIK